MVFITFGASIYALNLTALLRSMASMSDSQKNNNNNNKVLCEKINKIKINSSVLLM